jgi:ribosomal protein L11 methyltransferase
MWLSVALPSDAAHAEALSDALLNQGAVSVGVDDADAGSDRETPQFGEPGSPATPLWKNSRIVALFEPVDDLRERIAAALREAGLGPVDEVEIVEVAEQNWVQLTQSQFAPIRINDQLWIVPSWHVAPDPDAINLILDPGMAFGTGSHPTTHLCLAWLCDKVMSGATVLDYGCGSGILGLAAARLGAGRVVGVDIDDNALTAAGDNAQRNCATIELRHSRQELQETFDIVVANILTNPLCLLAPLLVDRLAPGGWLALSGVLAAQADQVRAAYAPLLDLQVGAELDGWVRLEGRRGDRQP